MKTGNCVVCGRPFEAQRSTRQYCSTTCRVRQSRALKASGLKPTPRTPKPYEPRAPHALMCQHCGEPFASHGNAKYCSRRCRYLSQKERLGRACSQCGALMSRDATRPTCGKCTAKRPPRDTRHPCPDCGVLAYGARCKRCQAKAQTIRDADDVRLRRKHRESAAPGLTSAQRTRLLAKWKRQGKACAYCDAPADTLDHVVPLVRGGTNYEGNLTPCCRACNGRKGPRLVIEMKAGRPAQRMRKAITWKPKPLKIKAIKGEQPPLFAKECRACGAWHSRTSDYCSPRCQARSLYRLRVGIPLDVQPYGLRASDVA